MLLYIYKISFPLIYTMLNDIKKIDAIDTASMLDTVALFPQQLEDALTLVNKYHIPDFIKIDDMVITGMGTSGITGDIITSLFYDKLDVPVYVNKSYDLPRWVHKDTLSLFLSYSGNSEETISSFKQAVQRKSNIITIASGGKLAEYAEKRNVPCIKLPLGLQPRAAIGYLLIPLLEVLKKNKIVKESIDKDIQEAIDVVKKTTRINEKTVPLEKNPAKQLATHIHQTYPKIYGWGLYSAVAQRWKNQFNENSKLLSCYEILPDANHNDIVGWSSSSQDTKRFSCIFFRDSHEESIYMKTRLDFFKVLCEEHASFVKEIKLEGKSRLAKSLYALNYGDFVSCYLAVLQEVDPTPIDVIHELKQRLATL